MIDRFDDSEWWVHRKTLQEEDSYSRCFIDGQLMGAMRAREKKAEFLKRTKRRASDFRESSGMEIVLSVF